MLDKIPHHEYPCPNCDEEVVVEDNSKKELVSCPNCHLLLLVDRDGEFIDGSWHDRTSLIPREPK